MRLILWWFLQVSLASEVLSEQSDAADQREDRAFGEQLAKQGEMNLKEILPGANLRSKLKPEGGWVGDG
jgi:hypothetical protein